VGIHESMWRGSSDPRHPREFAVDDGLTVAVLGCSTKSNSLRRRCAVVRRAEQQPAEVRDRDPPRLTPRRGGGSVHNPLPNCGRGLTEGVSHEGGWVTALNIKPWRQCRHQTARRLRPQRLRTIRTTLMAGPARPGFGRLSVFRRRTQSAIHRRFRVTKNCLLVEATARQTCGQKTDQSRTALRKRRLARVVGWDNEVLTKHRRRYRGDLKDIAGGEEEKIDLTRRPLSRRHPLPQCGRGSGAAPPKPLSQYRLLPPGFLDTASGPLPGRRVDARGDQTLDVEAVWRITSGPAITLAGLVVGGRRLAGDREAAFSRNFGGTPSS